MNRRNFLKTSLAAGSAAGLALPMANTTAADKGQPTTAQFYELRRYHLRRGPQQKRFEDFLREAAVPAFRRAGIGPIGVFQIAYGPDSPSIYVLLTAPTAAALLEMDEKLFADAEFKKAGADVLNAPPSDPAYVRAESSLMKSFEAIPRIEIPTAAKEKKPRLFELRTYESHSRRANKKKIEMFNQGEIAIFRRAGLQPVFFGETLIGAKLPNLTYMLVFDNMAAREKNWAAFASDPEWKKLSATPGYTDPEIVTNISNIFLRPLPFSEI